MAHSTTPVASVHAAQDLRANAVDRKRDRDTRKKWDPKWASSLIPVTTPSSHARPVAQRPRSQKTALRDRWSNQKEAHKVHAQKKRPALKDDEEDTTPDSSADEYVSRSKLLVEEEDYKYSFDAARGPSHGDEILTMALTQAVERFEDEKTTKLVKDEYEVLDDHGDEPAESSSLPHAKAVDGDVDEDDFEFV